MENLIGKIHHIGYMVKDIRKSIATSEKLGYQLEKNTYFCIDIGGEKLPFR